MPPDGLAKNKIYVNKTSKFSPNKCMGNVIVAQNTIRLKVKNMGCSQTENNYGIIMNVVKPLWVKFPNITRGFGCPILLNALKICSFLNNFLRGINNNLEFTGSATFFCQTYPTF